MSIVGRTDRRPQSPCAGASHRDRLRCAGCRRGQSYGQCGKGMPRAGGRDVSRQGAPNGERCWSSGTYLRRRGERTRNRQLPRQVDWRCPSRVNPDPSRGMSSSVEVGFRHGGRSAQPLGGRGTAVASRSSQRSDSDRPGPDGSGFRHINRDSVLRRPWWPSRAGWQSTVAAPRRSIRSFRGSAVAVSRARRRRQATERR